MGKLYYGNDRTPIVTDDRLLQYLQVVFATKLRRAESFIFSWTDGTEPGRSTIWLQPSIQLRFVFSEVEPARLTQGYLRQLADSAASSAGLVVDMTTWEADEAAHRPRLVSAA